MSGAEQQPAGAPSPDGLEGLVVDDEKMMLAPWLDPETTYDVLMNDRHVWSLRPDRDAVTAEGTTTALWPKALQRYLSGHADVALREHVSGEVVATTHHVFGGDDTGRVEVMGATGQDLVLDKWGRLVRPLSSEDGGVIDQLMDDVARLLETLRAKCGVPGFICYGTLLGAVRDGQLIGHDNDIDIAFVSEHPYPVDVVREGYRVERTLKEEGWDVRRGSGVRLNVRLRMRDGSMRFVDVFSAHWVEGVFFMPSDTGFRLPRETILPLSSVELMGHVMPAPADSEALLEATYGKSWRVPDPSFKYETPPPLSRRFGGWFGGLVTNRKHWDSFNAKAPEQVGDRPTPFARWVANRYPSTRPLVDVGTGTSRDARWFAKHGRRVTGIDYSIGAVHRGNRLSRARKLPARFEVLNLYDSRAVLTLGTRLSRRAEPVDLYARFVFHALRTPGQENLLRLASMSLRRGGLLFLEFRTDLDRGQPHVFGEHFRDYLEPATVVAEIEAAGGRIIERQEGTGLAPFKEEDPYVCRIVAAWAATDVTPAGGSAAQG